MRRSRSNDGTPNHTEALLPISRDALRRLLIIFTGEKREPRKVQTYHGPKAARGCPAPVLTDEQVLAIRQMRVWYGMTARPIAEATGVDYERVRGVLRMENRAHLDPGPRPVEA